VIHRRLLAMTEQQVCVVNAAALRDMEVLVAGLLAAEADGKHFLFRTAASFVQARAGLPTRPLLTAEELLAGPRDRRGGLFVVGSYVPKSTAQINTLLAQSSIARLELPVHALLDPATRRETIEQTVQQANHLLAQGDDLVLYTSRTLVAGDDPASSLAIGQQVSSALVAIVQQLTAPPRYLVAKGGITASDIATAGLGIRRAIVRGQILPGVPVWQTGAESRFPNLPYVVFPGNVGGDDALLQVYHTMAAG
jgi:uncharacterized protein YgbK (DUF1537 family)